jgi:hypothetical protein
MQPFGSSGAIEAGHAQEEQRMCVGVCLFCVRGQRVQRQQATACVTKIIEYRLNASRGRSLRGGLSDACDAGRA